MRLKHFIFTVLIFLITDNIYSQTKYDFNTIFSELIKPPQSIEEASVIFPLDSIQNIVVAGQEISDQETKLKKIKTDISNSLIVLKSKTNDMSKPPSGMGPPGGMTPPSGMGPPDGDMNSDNFSDIKEQMEKRAKASENITINLNKYKKEVLKNQEELNKKLKQTKQNENDLRISFVNEFLINNKTLYDKYYNNILINIPELNKPISNDQSSGMKNNPMLKIGLLKTQEELINTALFLFNITKQITEAGSMFYYGFK